MNEQNVTPADFEAMKAECTAIKNVNIQEVVGGYVINGAIEYRNGVSTIAVQRDVAVASESYEASILLQRYLDKGTFERENNSLFDRMVEASGQRMAQQRMRTEPQSPEKDYE